MPSQPDTDAFRSQYSPWCSTCPLRCHSGFEDFSTSELLFMEAFKQGHATARAGDVLVQQDDPKPRLRTLFSGWAAKYQTLDTGERQLLSLVLPGDLIGLESVLCGSSRHSVEAITDVSFCVFDPGRIDDLLAVESLARRLLKWQALEQRHTEQRLTAVGACDATRNLSFFMLDIHTRLQRRGAVSGLSFKLPLTRQQVAEALGITSVHVNRTVRTLREQQVLDIENRRVTIHDMDRLRDAACLTSDPGELRPLI